MMVDELVTSYDYNWLQYLQLSILGTRIFYILQLSIKTTTLNITLYKLNSIWGFLKLN